MSSELRWYVMLAADISAFNHITCNAGLQCIRIRGLKGDIGQLDGGGARLSLRRRCGDIAVGAVRQRNVNLGSGKVRSNVSASKSAIKIDLWGRGIHGNISCELASELRLRISMTLDLPCTCA